MQSKTMENLQYFLKKNIYIIPILIVAILSYGFVVTHYSINVDTLAANRYFEQGTLIGQGRITAPLLNKIFHIMEFNPFFTDALAVILLIVSAIIFCILFRKIVDTKLNVLSCTIFSCIFVSYPLINEIFVYTPASLLIAISFCLVAIALNMMYEYMQSFKLKYIIYSAIILFFAMSSYESFVAVYLCGIFMILILDILFNKQEKLTKVINKAVRYIAPLIVAIIMFLVIPSIVINVLNIEKNTFAAKQIMYGTLGLFGGIKNLLTTTLVSNIINALFYLPITVLFIASTIFCIMGIYFSVKKKSVTVLLLFLGEMISLISLSILQGIASPYRTCQSYPIFCAFTFMVISNIIIYSNVKKCIKAVFITLIFTIVLYQARSLSTTFYLNYVRYEEEKNALIGICNELEYEYGTEKPIIFVGKYELSDNLKKSIYVDKDNYKIKIARAVMKMFNQSQDMFEQDYKYIQTNINSYLNWGIEAFGEPNTEIFKWMNLLGYDFKQGNMEMLQEAKQCVENIKTKTIIEKDQYIIVNLCRKDVEE